MRLRRHAKSRGGGGRRGGRDLKGIFPPAAEVRSASHKSPPLLFVQKKRRRSCHWILINLMYVCVCILPSVRVSKSCYRVCLSADLVVKKNYFNFSRWSIVANQASLIWWWWWWHNLSLSLGDCLRYVTPLRNPNSSLRHVLSGRHGVEGSTHIFHVRQQHPLAAPVLHLHSGGQTLP